MADHLTFVPENSRPRNLAMQILFEILYALKYLLLYLPGLLMRPGDIVAGDKRPVVLVSGFFGSPLNWLKARRALVALGHPVYVVRLGFQIGNLRSYSEKLQKFLEHNNISDCYLVCHSMGGLVAAQMGYRGRDRTRKIFTLGTPFRGHPLSIILPFTIASWQMNSFSPFMRDTQAKYRTVSSIQAVFAAFDALLFLDYLNIPGRFDDVKLKQIGHYNLFMGPTGIECISELISSEEAKDPKPVLSKNQDGKVIPSEKPKKLAKKKTAKRRPAKRR